MSDERNEAIMASWRGETANVKWAYEPCAREHTSGRVCILPNEHEKDPVFLDFLHGQTYNTAPSVRHLILCKTSHHARDTQRAVTCEHDIWWGLSLAEMTYLSNKI